MKQEPLDAKALCQEMVENQIKRRGITDERLLAAFLAVPRHAFVPKEYLKNAYGDFPLPIGDGQTISQPYIIALSLSLLDIEKNDKVLEIGTGSGYQTAILSYLCDHVFSIERIPSLLKTAQQTLQTLKLASISFAGGDGTLGWPEAAPFDKILLSAAGPELPAPLLDQLRINGKMVMPIEESPFSQCLVLIEKKEKETKRRRICGVAFVPLVGKHGFEK